MIIKDIKDRCTTIKHLIEDGVRAKNLSMLNRGFSFFQQTVYANEDDKEPNDLIIDMMNEVDHIYDECQCFHTDILDQINKACNILNVHPCDKIHIKIKDPVSLSLSDCTRYGDTKFTRKMLWIGEFYNDIIIDYLDNDSAEYNNFYKLMEDFITEYVTKYVDMWISK